MGERVLVGFVGPEGVRRQLQDMAQQQRAQGVIEAGPLGQLSASRLGLPLFTLALGLLDGFNPCAMWVLLYLLSLLVHCVIADARPWWLMQAPTVQGSGPGGGVQGRHRSRRGHQLGRIA